MRLTAFAVLTVTTGILGACEGSEVRRPLLKADGFIEVDGGDADDVADGEVDGGELDGTEDGQETETDVGPLEPSLEFWFVGRAGELGRGLDEVTMGPADEPEAYLESAGFQIDLALETLAVASGEEVRFYVGDFFVGSTTVAVDDAQLGSAGFAELSLPESGTVVVRAETLTADGDPLVVSKTVTVDSGACVVEATIRVGPEACVALDPTALAPPFQAAIVEVSRLAGPCDRVGGTARLGNTAVTLAQTPFAEDGKAELVIPIDPSTSFVGDVVVEVVAIHPDDTQLNGTATTSARLDRVAPKLAWVAPPVGTQVVTLADDLDGVPGNGIQYDVRIDLTAAVDEATSAVLYLDDAAVAEIDASGPGAVDFGAISFLQDGSVVLRVELRDDCGNMTSSELAFDVVVTPDTIVIVSPDDGTVLRAADDGDAATAEVYETSFVVTASAAEVGTQIEVLCQAGSEVDPERWTPVGTFVVDALSADASYTVPVAADVAVLGQEVRCIARMTVPSELDSDPISITFAIPTPTVTIELPVAGSCSVGDTIGFAGTASGLDGQSLSLSGVGPGPDEGPIEVADFATVAGAASGDWSGTYTLGDADGPYRFSVFGEDTFGNTTVSDVVAVTVDRAPPQLALTSPSGPLDGATSPDEDAAAPGYQTTVVVEASELTSMLAGEVCLAVNGGLATCKSMEAVVTFTGVTLAAGDNLLLVSASDGCGNAADPVSQTVTLTLENPIAIVAPATDAVLLAAGDADPASATVYDMLMTVDADRASAGATIVVECRADDMAMFATVGTSAVTAVSANGVYDVVVAIDTVLIGTTVECRARVDLPNPGVSESVRYVLGLPAPTLTLVAPVANACFRADIPASGSATSLDSQPLTATLRKLDGTVVISSETTIAAGAWATSLVLGTLVDGSYAVLATASDTFGNPATSGTAVGVVVDRTLPVLALTAPPATEVVEADDTSTAAGIQVDVVVSWVDARAGGQACLAVGAATPVCLTAAATLTFEDVTLQPGDNTLTVSGTDACGNVATPVIVTRRLELDAPIVAITTPASDLITAATTIDIVATVTDTDLVPLAGLTVTLFKDAVNTGLTPVGAADGTYTFEDAPLTAGAANTFTVEAVRANAATGTSGPRIVTQKNTTPTIAIGTPAEGTLFLVASAACQVGQSDCVTSVSATTTNAEDTSAATLSVACGGGTPVVYSGAVSANAVTFTAVTLANGQACTLTPGVTDIVAQTATGTVVNVSVDRTAPTVVITSPDGVLQAGAGDDADAGTAGMQHALSATVGGVASGAVVSAVISWNDGAPQSKTLTHTVTTTTPDGGSYAATFEDVATPGLVTWPDGASTLVVSVSDVSGNPTSATLQVAVDTASGVRITGPALVPADACGGGCAAGTICQAGACWISWGVGSPQLVVQTSSLQTSTNNIRVCSDSLALTGGGAALCASAASATGPYRQVMLGNAGNGVGVLNLNNVLPAAEQRLVVEVLPILGGAWVSSQAASASTEQLRRVFVDEQGPVISAISSPSDDLPIGGSPDGILNAAEQEAVPRAYDITFTVSEAGRAEVYVNGAVAQTQDVAAGATTVRVTLPEGSPQVWIVMSDAVNNRSPATPGLGARTYQPTVDVTAPTLVFTRPTKSPLKLGDILDVVLTSDAEGRMVTLVDGVAQATAMVSGGSVTFASFLTDGSHTLSASVSDVAGNTGVAATNPATVLVDTVPPSGEILVPIDEQDLLEGDDADPAAGYQVAVTFSTTDATTWTLATAKGCTGSQWSGCAAPIVKASGPVTQPGGTEPIATVTLDLDAAVSRHKIFLETFDAAGNVHSTSVKVLVIVNCAVSFRNLPVSGWFNAATCGSPASCPNVPIDVGVAGNCGNTLELFDGSTSLGSVAISGAGVHTFSITVTNGVGLSLEGIAYQDTIAATRGSTGIVPVGVDLVPPLVGFVSTTIGTFVTPAEGEAVVWGFADDLNTGNPGMQFSAAVMVDDSNADGGAITALTATSAAGTVDLTPSNGSIPRALSGPSPTVQFLGLALADDAVHTVTVTASDAAGNVDTGTFTATVDVTRPGTVTITDFTVDPRRPRFPVTWTAVGDDGATGAAAAHYEVRYSTQPIVSEANWDAACDGSLAFGSDPMPSPGSPGQPMSVAIGGPDPRPYDGDGCKLEVRFEDAEPPSDVALYWAVRAFDEVGNASELTDESRIEVSNAELWNELSRVTLDNSSGAFGGNYLFLSRRGSIIGDINGDGRPDWAIGSLAASGFCVFLGQANPPPLTTISTKQSATHACLASTDVATFFPGVVPAVTQTGHLIQGLGDLNGDGFADFGVSGKMANGTGGAASLGYVAVYFGRASGLPTLTAPNILVRGLRAATGGVEYVGFCSPGDFDGLTSNGRLTSDLAIGEPYANVLHVIPGNGAWTASDAIVIDRQAGGLPTSSSWSVGGTFTVPTATTALFGQRCAPAGDVLATTLGSGAKADLLVRQSGGSDARVFVFAGREWSGAVSETVSENLPVPVPAGTEDARSLRLRQETGATVAGYAAAIQGEVDVTGDGVADILVSNAGRRPAAGDGRSVYIFDGSKLEALRGTDVRVGATGPIVGESWTGTNGWVLRADVGGQPSSLRAFGNFDGWTTRVPAVPTLDLAIANFAGSTIALWLNHESTADSLVLGQFPAIDGQAIDPNHFVNDGIGLWIDGADLDQDGLVDFITGGNFGEVVFFH